MVVNLQQSLQFYKYIFIGWVMLVASCAAPKEQQRPKGGMDAEILNLSDSTIHIESDVPPLAELRGEKPQIALSVTVDSNGIFMVSEDFPEGYYWIKADLNAMRYFVQEGKKLSLDFDATKPFQKPDFSGKLKYESRYLFDRFLLISSFKASENLYLSQSEQKFTHVISDLRAQLDTALVIYITNHPTGSKEFMKQEALRNYYLSAFYFEKYFGLHQRTGRLDSLSQSFLALRANVNPNDKQALQNDMYFKYLTEYTQNNYYPITDISGVNRAMLWVDSVFLVSDYEDFAYYQLAKKVTPMKIEDKRHVLDTLVNSISDNLIQRKLIQEIIADTSAATLQN